MSKWNRFTVVFDQPLIYETYRKFLNFPYPWQKENFSWMRIWALWFLWKYYSKTKGVDTYFRDDWNIVTGIQNICTVPLINILASGAERITAVSASRKEWYLCFQSIDVALELSETVRKRKQYSKSDAQKNFLKEALWCKSHQNLKSNSKIPQKNSYLLHW